MTAVMRPSLLLTQVSISKIFEVNFRIFNHNN